MCINIKTTNEFTDEEWVEFEGMWLRDYVESCEEELGMTSTDAIDEAELRFEQYLNQEGYHSRNERILMQRERAQS